jgi:16S rRNA (cytosine967-C5)-methyltransferase
VSGNSCRAVAATTLAQVIAGGSSLNEPLAAGLAEVKPEDRALLQQLCYGSLRSYQRLNAVLRQLLKKPLKRKDADIEALILCGLYQLLEMRTPDHAAISTSVEACRVLGKPWATGLVNGVLRRCSRESGRLLAALDEAAQSSHPRWLLEALKSAWPEHFLDIVNANNGHPPMCLRINTRKTHREDYLRLLEQAEISAHPCAQAVDGIRLATPIDVSRLPGFDDGLVSVQDEAAQFAAAIMQAAPGDRVLDACAAPGGKACHILEGQAQLGGLVAMDLNPARLQRLHENLNRLQLSAEVIIGDGRQPPESLAGESFDHILVDAPCSGTGVIRRHPDIKLLRQASDIPGFATLQLSILKGVWPLLRSGGRLLYVTCSVLPEENNELIEAFLQCTSAAQLLPLALPWGLDLNGARQLLPTPDGTDGLFYALLQKVI